MWFDFKGRLRTVFLIPFNFYLWTINDLICLNLEIKIFHTQNIKDACKLNLELMILNFKY